MFSRIRRTIVDFLGCFDAPVDFWEFLFNIVNRLYEQFQEKGLLFNEMQKPIVGDVMKIRLYEMPAPSTDFESEALLINESTIRYFYRREEKLIEGNIIFNGVSALRMRVERCCTEWHIKEAYDTLIEVNPSKWSQEIYDATTPHLKEDQKYRHFMIYLDSVGCYEFIASDWKVFERIVLKRRA